MCDLLFHLLLVYIIIKSFIVMRGPCIFHTHTRPGPIRGPIQLTQPALLYFISTGLLNGLEERNNSTNIVPCDTTGRALINVVKKKMFQTFDKKEFFELVVIL